MGWLLRKDLAKAQMGRGVKVSEEVEILGETYLHCCKSSESDDAAEEPDEDDIAPMALAGLAEANRKTAELGLPIVYVEGDKLIRKENGVKTVLKRLPRRMMREGLYESK